LQLAESIYRDSLNAEIRTTRQCVPTEGMAWIEEDFEMVKSATSCAATCMLLLTGIVSATSGGSDVHADDFSQDGGIHYGTSYVTYYNGHSDLQLVSDGQPGTYGTWQTGHPTFDYKSMTSFSVSFNFSFNTNGNGGLGDGFSFLFGDMSDMSGNNWEGGEWGLNAFSNAGSGMSIGFDTYGEDSGIYARWGSSNVTWANFGTEWWYFANEENYDDALTDANQGSVIIDWDINSGLVVRIDWGGDPIDGYYEAINTSYFTWPDGYDMAGWDFGFAARNGGIDNDILIDNLVINYTYIALPEPEGACCISESCQIYTAQACAAVKGNYLGDDTTCEDEGQVCDPGCPSDINEDGIINVDDLLICIGGWGTDSGDVNEDGLTNIDDLLALIKAWGDCP